MEALICASQVGLAGDATTAVFGVFDGHGGAEVAKFCQKYMSKEIQKLEQFGEGRIEDSLVQVSMQALTDPS